MDAGVAVAETDGEGTTVMEAVAVAEQPTASEPVTVYTVFTVGDAITTAPILVFNPIAGIQE
jgi:hypothetical protein